MAEGVKEIAEAQRSGTEPAETSEGEVGKWGGKEKGRKNSDELWKYTGTGGRDTGIRVGPAQRNRMDNKSVNS